MDGSTFDRLSQLVSSVGTRRSALSALAAAGLGGVLLSASDTEGKGKGKKKRKRKCKKVAGKPCTSDSQCCNGKTNNVCAVRSGAGNSDKTCCGSTGAKCGGFNEDRDAVAPFCCQGFTCNATGTGVFGACQPAP